MCWNVLGMRAASMVVAFAVWAVAASASAESEATMQRVVVVDQLPKRPILNLGEISPGATRKVEISLRSELNKPLSIRSVSSDCGCLRVSHDPNAVSDDGSLILEVELSPASKLGRIRRNVRIFFQQEPSSPLDLGLDTLVVGPIAFLSPHLSVGSTTDPVVIPGIKTSAGLEVLSCEPTRGSCRTLTIDQTAESFSVRARPLISFGSVNEIFRIRYRERVDSEPVTLDLPLELRCMSAVRFFPSVATIRFENGAWTSETQLLLAPGSQLNLDHLQLSIEREDGSPWNPSDYQVVIRQASVVLYALHVTCSAPHHDSNRPARLKVASPRGELLSTLVFSSP